MHSRFEEKEMKNFALDIILVNAIILPIILLNGVDSVGCRAAR